MSKEDTCQKCLGQQIMTVTESVDLHIQCGFPNKERVVIDGKGNEHPDYLAGDLVVTVTVAKDNTFTRVNNDLHVV